MAVAVRATVDVPRRADEPPVVLVANTSWYLFNFRSGTITALRRQGHRVVCIAPQDSFSRRLVDELGVEYIPLAIAGGDRGWRTELATLWATIVQIRRLRPRFVFNFTIKANIYSGLASWLARVPFANNVSGLGTAFLHDRWLFRMVRRSYLRVNEHASRLFFQNPADLQQFRDAGLKRSVPTTVLPGSGVDLSKFTFQAMPRGPVRFVLIARLLGDKGVREYVEAARVIRRTHPEVQCLLVGPHGAANQTAIHPDEVRDWIDEGVVDYRGELADVRAVLAQTHALVLPSYREGMPKTVLEAAATGRPAIVSDVPGCRHAIVPEVTGWLCQPRDVDSLVAAMRQFIEMGSRQRIEAGQAARRLAEERFSETFVIDAYLACLQAHSCPQRGSRHAWS
jgi:glycosyltransferase involved in cell wall biosynthesis